MTSDHFMSQILPINWPTIDVTCSTTALVLYHLTNTRSSYSSLINLKFLNWFLAPPWTSRAECIYFGGNIKGKWKKSSPIKMRSATCNSGCELLQKFRKHRKNCECCPGHYLSTSVYLCLLVSTNLNLNRCLCSHCSQCLLVPTSVYYCLLVFTSVY